MTLTDRAGCPTTSDRLADNRRGRSAETLARLQLGQRIERTSLTVAQVAQAWLDRGIGQKGPWAPSTKERYEQIVRVHIDQSNDSGVHPLGCVKLRDLTVDRVAAWSRANEGVLAPTTAVITLETLNQVCRFALRRGWIASNPVGCLEPALTGLRIGEALGLCWADVDLDSGVLRVHRHLSREREHRPLKTEAGRREVVLAPAIAKLLRERWLASSHKAADDLVFCAENGRGLDCREVGKGFRQAVKRAGLPAEGKRLSLHSLRHSFASLLTAKGLNVVFVSRQLGHANPNITLGVYAHLFGQADHAASAREALEASYEAMGGTTAL